MPFRSEDEGGARKTQSAALTARREREDDNPCPMGLAIVVGYSIERQR